LQNEDYSLLERKGLLPVWRQLTGFAFEVIGLWVEGGELVLLGLHGGSTHDLGEELLLEIARLRALHVVHGLLRCNASGKHVWWEFHGRSQ
jgi:hypothetical protein